MSKMSKRAQRSAASDTDGSRHGVQRSTAKNTTSRVSRTTCFMRIVLLCLVISGICIARYPSFIEQNIHTKGDVEVKLNDVVTVPLKPERTFLKNRKHYYMLPPLDATIDGKPKGLLIYLHSCRESGLEFFTLPEHRIIARDAIQKGLVVFSPTSFDRDSGCFTQKDAGTYLKTVVSQFVHRNQLQSLPRVGLGHSSGGVLLSFLQNSLQLESMAVYNSPQDYAELRSQEDALIPTVYLTMSNDGSISNRMNASMSMLQERNINSYHYKASPRPLTKKLCAARLPEVTDVFCDHILETIQKDHSGLIDADGYVLEGDFTLWERCFEKLEWEYENFADNLDLLKYERMKSDGERSWLRVILEEEIKTCYGYHAMTAQFHDEILEFLVSNSNMVDESPGQG